MKSTRFWILLLSAILLISVGATACIITRNFDDTIANIYQDGECIYSIDLSQVALPYTIEVSGSIINIIAIENGRICVIEATCPDQICVHQGWISNSIMPVVCLPNKLVIKIENTPGDTVDGITR